MVSIKKYFTFKNSAFLVLCSAVVYVAGYQVGFRSWDQKVSVRVHSNVSARNLASTKEDLDRQVASVDHQIYSDTQNVFKNSKVVSSAGDQLEFLVGNVLHNDSQGNQQFVCDSFSTVRLIFEAFHVAMAGEKVLMQLVAPCKKHSDFQFIGPFSLPRKKIRSAPISSTDFETKNGRVHFQNVSISWPKSWIFVRAEFLDSSKSAPYFIHTAPPQSEEDVFLITL